MKCLFFILIFASELLSSGPHNGYVYINVTNHVNYNNKPFIILNISKCDNEEGETEDKEYIVESREEFIFRHNKVFMETVVPYYHDYGTLKEWYPSNKVSNQLYPPSTKELTKEIRDNISNCLIYILNDDFRVRNIGYEKLLNYKNDLSSFERPNDLTPEQHTVLDVIIRNNEIIDPNILRELRKDIFFLSLCYHNATKENKVNIVNEIVSKFYIL